MKTAELRQTPDRPEWRVSPNLVPYPDAIATMEARVEALEAGQSSELIWLLEHPPLYTAGTSAVSDELIDPTRFPVFKVGRGGRYTYHGPGQRVIYVVSDLRQRDRDVRQHVCRLEEWIIQTLRALGVDGGRREGRIGIWVNSHGRDEKIAAIGVRVRRWITYYGLSLNVNPNLAHFSGIVPCGLATFGVTSLEKLGVDASMTEVDAAFLASASGIVY